MAMVRFVSLFVFAAALEAGDFETKVLPLFQAKCVACHAEGKGASGFTASSLAGVLKGGARLGMPVVPGVPEKSPLFLVLTGKLQPSMPLGGRLKPEELAVVENWIRGSADEIRAALPKKEVFWAYQKPKAAVIPTVKNSSWVRNELDRFVLAKLEARSIAPAPEADRRTLVRRLYFDLIGLPPTPADVRAFVESKDPDFYEKTVDKLLADPRYGERWGRHWLDVARYSDTNGYEEDTEYFHAWRYRDYVIDAFNSDKPYDQFIIEQLAGDEWKRAMGTAVPAAEPEKVVAMTFLRLAPFNKTPQSDENRDSVLSEIVSTTSSAFLGLTVGCAKCHDHKYDQIPQKDFYRMKAFFATMQISSGGRVGGSEPAAFFKPGQKEWAEKESARIQSQAAELKREFETLEKSLIARLGAHRKKEVKASEVRGLIIREIDNTQSLDVKDNVFSKEEHARYRQLTDRIAWCDKALVRLQPRAWSIHNADGPPLGPSVPTTYVQVRGDWDRLGEPVEPGFLSALTGSSEPAALELDPYRMFPTRGRRMTLARWIANADNPLTARVMVNRIWHHHFGRGIVETTGDFGRNGSPPSHPELLDWLALQFVDKKWSVKAMHRLMLSSAAYRQASNRQDETAAKLDADNRLLWRFNARRIEGEAVRDSILFVAGRLNPEQGGLPVYPPMPKDLDPIRIKSVDTWELSTGPETRKRSVYIFQRRSQNFALLETLDAAVPNATCDRRRQSVTALQALTLYNGDFANEEAAHFADRLIRESGPDPREQVDLAYQLAVGRSATVREKAVLLTLMGKAASPREAALSLSRVIFNSNEFVYID